MRVLPGELAGSPPHSHSKTVVRLEVNLGGLHRKRNKVSNPNVLESIRLARELRAELDEKGLSMHQIARERALTTARVSQLVGILTLPRQVLEFIAGLSGQDLGARFLTERRVRRWVVLRDPERQVAAFRRWREGLRDEVVSRGADSPLRMV